MKKNFVLLCLATLLTGAVAFAQTVTTDPVGFINIAVTGGTQSHPGVTYVSPTLTNPISYQGTIASITSTTITITGASFTANQFNGTNGSYYVEVFSATKPGALSDITATGSNSVTTQDDLTPFASVGDSVRIRQHVTINEFLGATNPYGLLGSVSSATTADNILIYMGGSQTTFWYYSGTPGVTPSDAGWYSTDGLSDGSTTIAPFQGIIILRRGAGSVTITSTGTVKTGNTLFPVVHGANYLGTLSAQGLTLASSGLVSSGLVGSESSATTSDQIYIYQNGVLKTYWYYAGTPGVTPTDAAWYDTDGYLADSQPLAPGATFILNRIEGGAFNWTQPAPSSF